MRKPRIFTVLIFAALSAFISIHAQAETSITITSYNEPSSLCKGNTINLTWIGTELRGSTAIEILKANEIYHTLIITYMNNEVISLPLMIAR